jgi:sulfoxide reductase heme-binding subunit YedZ
LAVLSNIAKVKNMHSTNPDTRKQTGLSGWPLLAAASSLLLAMSLAIIAAMPGVDGIRMLIRATARTSLLFFLLAFVAAAAWALWPAAPTRWLRANRRYLGLSFAVSHGIHALAIFRLARVDPALFHQLANSMTYLTGGLAYLYIVAMSATSFDRSAAWLGPRGWKLLHGSGVFYLWISFIFSFGKRLGQGPFYTMVLAVLVGALALRVAARIKLGKMRAAGASAPLS